MANVPLCLQCHMVSMWAFFIQLNVFLCYDGMWIKMYNKTPEKTVSLLLKKKEKFFF